MSRIVWRMVRRTALVTLVASALLLALVRLALPGVAHYRAEIAAELGELLGAPVRIGALHAGWSGWSPLLRVDDLRLLRTDGAGPIARFRNVTLSLDPLASLRAGALRLGRIEIRGAALSLTRHADGTITMSGTSAGTGGDQVLAWLAAQPRLRLRASTLLIHDMEAGGTTRRLRDVSLDLRNDGKHHRAGGTLTLPEQLGGRMRFILDLRGSLLGRTWSGEAYFQTWGMNSGLWNLVLARAGARLRSATSGLEVWTRWRDARLQRLDALADITDAVLATGGASLGPGSVRARANLSRAADGWRLALATERLAGRGRTWPALRLRATLRRPADTDSARIVGNLNYLPLGAVAPLAAARLGRTPALRRLIASLHGSAEEVRFALAERAGTLRPVALSAAVRGLGFAPAGAFPGIEGLDAHLAWSENAAEAAFTGAGFSLHPSTGSAPVAIDRASGRLFWQRLEGGWRLGAEGVDLAAGDSIARLQGTVSERADAVHTVGLLASLRGVAVARALALTPPGALPQKVRAWLRRALPRGEIGAARLLMRGPVAALPFDGIDGQLQARIALQGLELDYDPRWPPIDRLDATVALADRHLDIEVPRATVMGYTVHSARARIDDLGAAEPLAVLNVDAAGPLAEVQRFVMKSPLRGEFDRTLGALTLHGPSTLAFRLNIPISKRHNTISGALRLQRDQATVGHLAHRLEDLSGTLRFTNDALRSRELQATYRGRRVRIALERKTQTGALHLGFDTTASPGWVRALVRDADPALVPWVDDLLAHTSGDAALSASARLAGAPGQPGTSFALRSDLRGLAVTLPAPFGKARDAARAFELRAEPAAGGGHLLTLRYAHALGAVFALGTTGARALRGTLKFDPAAVPSIPGTLPTAPGIDVEGRLDALDLGPWYTLANRPGKKPNPGAPRVERLDLAVDHLQIFGEDLGAIRIRHARGSPGRWRLDGARLDGTVHLPAGDGALRIDLRRLVLSARKGGATAKRALQPSSFPSLAFRCVDLRYAGRDLGRAVFVADRTPDGLRLRTIELTTKGLHVEGSGAWRSSRPGRSETALSLRIRSESLAALLAVFGAPPELVAGAASKIELSVEWPAPPWSPSFATISGRIGLRANEGRLLEVRASVIGRAFALLSITALPQRLQLDFGDLFKRGMSFEHMEGAIELRAGDAYTNDFTIDSSAATIEVSGRVGLIAQDYDESITVTPKLASTLPLAGAVLGPVGIGIGSAIWLSGKLFGGSPLDRAVSYRYSVTGPWSKPVVKRVETEHRKAAPKG